MLCNGPNCKIEEPAFTSQLWNCDVMTHHCVSLRAWRIILQVFVNSRIFTKHHTGSIHLLSKNTHLSDQFDWMLLLPCTHTNLISRFRTSFNSLNRWRNSFDWFWVGSGRPKEKFMSSKILWVWVNGFARRAAYQYVIYIRVASIWK